MTPSPYWSTLRPGEERDFTAWIDPAATNKANPARLITGLDFSVEIIAGTRTPAVAPGCTFGKPWE